MNGAAVVQLVGDREPAPSTVAPAATLPRLLKIDDAARELSVSTRMLRDLIARGRVPVVRIGGCVRIARDVVELIVREGVSP